MNWEKIRNKITKENYSSFYEITDDEYFAKWGMLYKFDWITNNSEITEKGFRIYISTLNHLGKNTILGGPRRFEVLYVNVETLEKTGIIRWNSVKKKYVLGDNGPGILEVLIRCMQGRGNPKI